MGYVPLSKLHKPTSFPYRYLDWKNLTILRESLSKILITSIWIKSSNKYLPKKWVKTITIIRSTQKRKDYFLDGMMCKDLHSLLCLSNHHQTEEHHLMHNHLATITWRWLNKIKEDSSFFFCLLTYEIKWTRATRHISNFPFRYFEEKNDEKNK